MFEIQSCRAPEDEAIRHHGDRRERGAWCGDGGGGQVSKKAKLTPGINGTTYAPPIPNP